MRASEADRGDATGLATARLGTATDRGSSSDTLLPSSSADRGRDAGRDVLPTDELADGIIARCPRGARIAIKGIRRAMFSAAALLAAANLNSLHAEAGRQRITR